NQADGPEIVLQAGGVIDGSGGDSPTFATIEGAGEIRNGGAIRLPDDRIDVAVTDHHYEAAFDSQGGSAVPSPVRVYAGSFAAGARAFPPDPTRAGYVFAGWNTAADGSGTPLTAGTELPDSSS